jgi:hypothetical protein
MRRDQPRITFGKLALAWFSALTAVTVVAIVTATGGWFMTAVRAGGSPMAGDWVGMCQDGRPFVMLALRPAVGGYDGLISLGNVKITSEAGDAHGSCTVNDAASSEHSMKIVKASVAGGILTFDSEHGQEYEMRMVGNDTAQLRFVGTNRDESWFLLRRRGSGHLL